MKKIVASYLIILFLFVSTIYAQTTPFPGSNNRIPGTIQYENFDLGGPGKGFSDAESGNQMAAFDWFVKDKDYRSGDGKDVDINYDGQTTDGGSHIIGFIVDGEWLKYTVSDIVPGRYKVSAFYTTPFDDEKNRIKVEINGEESVEIPLKRTGGWANYESNFVYFDIKSAHRDEIMKITFLGDSYNADKIVFELDQAGAFKNHKIPGVLEAEDYDIGPNKSFLNGASASKAAYNDLQQGNQLLPYLGDKEEYRAGDGVDVGWGGEEEGYVVGWIEEGEFLNYTLSNIEEGDYMVSLRIATDKKMLPTNKVKLKLDGKTICEFKIPNSGGWGSYIEVPLESSIRLMGSTKPRTLNLYFDGDGSFNLNKITFTKLAKPFSNKTDEEKIFADPNAIVQSEDVKINIEYEILTNIVYDYSVEQKFNKIGIQFRMPNTTPASTVLKYNIVNASGKSIVDGNIEVQKGINEYIFDLERGKFETGQTYVIEIPNIMNGKTHKIKFVH